MIPASVYKYILSVIVLLLSVAVLLYAVSISNINDFKKTHTTIAENAVIHTAELMSLYLNNIRHDVKIYSSQFSDEIKHLANNPLDQKTKSVLTKSLTEYFPDAFTFTIANSSGDVLLDDVKGLVGRGCRENIRIFAIDNHQSDAAIRIHSDKYDYHFDIMNELQRADGQIIIYFVSFKPTIIASYLDFVQPTNHKLYLIKKDSNNLIEVTSKGARVKIERKDKHLTKHEIERIDAAYEIKNTLWEIVDVVNDGVIATEENRIIKQSLLTFLIFVLLGVLSLLIICRHEYKRHEMELLLEENRHQLEEKIKERTAELSSANEKIEGMALQDGLTGIANRTHFDHVLSRDLQRSIASNEPFSIILFSVDDFTHFNEVAGYQAGDNCLKKICHEITAILEKTNSHELFARYTSIEFALLLPNYTLEAAHELSTTIKQNIWNLNIAHVSSELSDRVTLSIGVVSINAESYTTSERLTDRLEAVLYKAKQHGKNQIIVDT